MFSKEIIFRYHHLPRVLNGFHFLQIILFIRKIGERDGRVSSSVGSTGGSGPARGLGCLVEEEGCVILHARLR
jgi:hypothetical protein